MKKNAVLIICLLVSILAVAQKGFTFGGNFTPGLSYMLAQNNYYLAPDPRASDPSKELDYKPKFSFNSALFFGYNFSEKHGIRTYAGYNVEGQKYQDIFKWPIYGLQGTHTKEVNFQFINTGVAYKFAPILKGQKEKNPNGNYPNGQYKMRMRMLVGVETDILLNASMSYSIKRLTEEDIEKISWQGYWDKSPAPDFSQYPYIAPGQPIGLPPSYPPQAPFGNGGYAPYYDMGKPASEKDYFVPVQAALTLNYGFDYIFKNNMYFGIGFDAKVGLNDINDKAYRIHPKYKKSKNYFFGLKAEIGYNVLKDKTSTPKPSKKSEVKDSEKTITPEPAPNYKPKDVKEKAYTTYTGSGKRKDVNLKKSKKKKKK